jgi:hypothetical protein
MQSGISTERFLQSCFFSSFARLATPYLLVLTSVLTAKVDNRIVWEDWPTRSLWNVHTTM